MYRDRDPFRDDPRLKECQTTEINDLLVGRTVTAVGHDTLVLDDGTRLRIEPNEGCGGCPSGYYELDALNGCDNVITRADVEVDGDDYGDESSTITYTLFVFADHERINLATVSGSDGNGYYGTGFHIRVSRAK